MCCYQELSLAGLFSDVLKLFKHTACKTENLPVGDWWFMYCTSISSWEKGISLECLVLPCNSTIPSHSQLIYGSMLASSCVLQTHHTSIDPQGLIRKNQPLFGQGVTKKIKQKTEFNDIPRIMGLRKRITVIWHWSSHLSRLAEGLLHGTSCRCWESQCRRPGLDKTRRRLDSYFLTW